MKNLEERWIENWPGDEALWDLDQKFYNLVESEKRYYCAGEDVFQTGRKVVSHHTNHRFPSQRCTAWR
jgi:hypothetical protein